MKTKERLYNMLDQTAFSDLSKTLLRALIEEIDFLKAGINEVGDNLLVHQREIEALKAKPVDATSLQDELNGMSERWRRAEVGSELEVKLEVRCAELVDDHHIPPTDESSNFESMLRRGRTIRKLIAKRAAQ
jgi:hypothetical protein